MAYDVSIVIPVLNKLEFTRQCLDRLWRNTDDTIAYEVIVVDNGSSDGTVEWFSDLTRFPRPVQYQRNSTNLGFSTANNVGARLSRAEFLLFLNNDTLVQGGWLAGMLRARRLDAAVGIVGIKQLFPYTNTIYHTGIVFTPDGRPEHLYPHLDASLPKVNKQREYQAVTGACLMIDRALFDECGGFDEEYRNGYEDIDLCLKVRQRRRKVVCCTTGYIYHYGQISEGRTSDDDSNAALFATRWAGHIRADRDEYLVRDRADADAPSRPSTVHGKTLADDCIYLADDLGQGSALTWINAELALALKARGIPVFINGTSTLSPTFDASARRTLMASALKDRPVGGTQIKWSHYWTRHLRLELAGDVNLEFFVINYLFGRRAAEPWDYWLQSLRGNGYDKLPLSEFCQSVLQQVGVPERACHVWHPGYSPEIHDVDAPTRTSGRFRFLTVTNSHDPERYNTEAILESFQRAFGKTDDATLVIKDYGASSGDTAIRSAVARRDLGPRIEYISEFTDKRELVRLYKSCDAFVSAHRGEGFGMKILDAMACGLPVLTPLFGGPTAYCAADNCLPVDHVLVPMGSCMDSASLRITNQPVWAEVNRDSLVQQMRKAHEDRPANARLGARARAAVVDRLSWASAAVRFAEIVTTVRAARPGTPRSEAVRATMPVERSPYWLGLRVTVVIPTHNRKAKLLASLESLAQQSVLPQEFEVIVVDDGSTDGTKTALDACRFPFALRYFRQDQAGPGAARNLGIEHAAGEVVLFIGDDILADQRLIEEHLLAHASSGDPGLAVLGRIDWPATMTPNAVMDYVCGDAMLQFAYSYIPHAPHLDHRFFYTSNISLKRQFLTEAAGAGIRFDPSFRRAAFEDSEFAFRLMPRGLTLQYVEGARATHDHWMDLDTFARREFGAGEMAVVFYRKHPGEDAQLQVQWLADFVEPVSVLLGQPDFLRRLEAFDRQTDTLLRALAASLEELMAIAREPAAAAAKSVSQDGLRAALHNVLRVVFDVERTRGKLQEWYATVDDPTQVQAAKTLASVMRKIEFLNLHGGQIGLADGAAVLDAQVTANLGGRFEQSNGARPGRKPLRALLGLAVSSKVLPRLLATDRFLQARLHGSARQYYHRARSWIRTALRS